ncbi:MAG: tRNA pseudouridine(38-40) synthase TruA [Bryobacteraceae bacterium]
MFSVPHAILVGMAERRLRFDVSYDGSEFHGWQIQPGLRTIQGELESVIATIEGKPVAVIGSGRTDAGVHAVAQVAAITLENPIPTDNFRRAVNRLISKDIRVTNVREAEITFHPRFDAVRKTYEYRIFREEICPPFSRRYMYHHPYPLDELGMINAAPVIEGEHDFTAFAAADEKYSAGQTMVRTIYRSELHRDGELLIYRVTGSGFLKHMVRNVMGVLLQVGRGNLAACDVTARLMSGCSIPPGPTAPASGLFLVSVEYDG